MKPDDPEARSGKREMKALGQYLAGKRERKYDTAWAVGKRLGGEPGYYAQIESGRRCSSPTKLLTIMGIIGLDADERAMAIRLAAEAFLAKRAPKLYRDALLGIAVDPRGPKAN